MDLLHNVALFNESGQSIPVYESIIHKIVQLISEGENVRCSLLEVVFVDNEEIVRLNKQYLERDSVTDVISFSYGEDESNHSERVIDGTLYCCAQRIEEQAKEWNVSRESEFRRIVIHGILHLVGYEDTTAEQKKVMRNKENIYLEQLGSLNGH